jgi:acyl-CoA synthetase (AMP-forming)/AMP-acid ligase II
VGVALRVCEPRPRSLGTHAPFPLQDVAPGALGEICVAGPSVITGYTGQAGAEAFQEGWFRTGDLGYQDAAGYVFLTGRLREVIIRGGENITPREVEETLLAHPSVAEAVVAGLPDPLLGERVVAYVVVREPWSEPLCERLCQHCTERLSPHKVPATLIALDALPRTASGKVDRARLRREPLATLAGGQAIDSSVSVA